MPQPSARLYSLQIALPRELAGDLSDRPWTTGFYKLPVTHAVEASVTGLVGDGQADLVNHGGADKAICAYPLAHYPHWQQIIGRELSPAAFGENFTLAGITEADVCIGDIWRVGDDVVVQVSQPRQPCWKLVRRWQRKTLALEAQESGKTGWYFRVLAGGKVQAGKMLTLVERLHADWSIARANQVMHIDKHDLALAAELAALPELSASWQRSLTQRANKGVEKSITARLTPTHDAAPLPTRDKRS
jgi:MOSC domain-containing protein YiiM